MMDRLQERRTLISRIKARFPPKSVRGLDALLESMSMGGLRELDAALRLTERKKDDAA